MNLEKDIEEYKHLMENIKREGIEDLINFVIESDYFICPASSKYHSNIDGGLYLHSKNVLRLCYEQINLLKKLGLELEISRDSIILCCLHHDICKINNYKKDILWYKNEDNKWTSYVGWKIDESDILGHGSKSLSILQDYIKLTLQEKQAILYHMGTYDQDKFEVMNVFNSNKFAQILHIADMSSLVIEKIKDHKI